MQSISLNTLWDLSLAYFIFSSQREGVYKRKRSGKCLASQELPAMLPLFAPLRLMTFFFFFFFYHQLAQTEKNYNFQVLGFKFLLLVFLRSWDDACCASCYSSQPGDKCQSWHERHVLETQRKPKVNSSHSALGLGVPVTTCVSSSCQT